MFDRWRCFSATLAGTTACCIWFDLPAGGLQLVADAAHCYLAERDHNDGEKFKTLLLTLLLDAVFQPHA